MPLSPLNVPSGAIRRIDDLLRQPETPWTTVESTLTQAGFAPAEGFRLRCPAHYPNKAGDPSLPTWVELAPKTPMAEVIAPAP